MEQSAATYLFENIVLPSGCKAFLSPDGDAPLHTLGPLAKINIFVGANNSGKSYLMRSIATCESIQGQPQTSTWIGMERAAAHHAAVHERARLIIKAFEEHGFNDINNVREDLEALLKPLVLKEKTEVPYPAVIRKIADAHPKVQGTRKLGDKQSYDPGAAWARARELAQQSHSLDDSRPRGDVVPSSNKLYIPILRSLRDVNEANSNDLLEACTLRAYFTNDRKVPCFTGQTMYAEVETLLRGDHNSRNQLRVFEDWIGKAFFQGQQVALIPRIGKKVLFIKIGKEQEKEIHHLGDGIQSLLILTFPLFKRAQEHLMVFIEEAEMFLHPWLQRILLEVLATKFPRHQYFLTTHSNHLLDLTIDVASVSVFSFEKHLPGDGEERTAKFHVREVSREDRRPLELLGVRNSSVLLSNCTIWVEGITDRRYISHWLDLLQRSSSAGDAGKSAASFKEDLHFSFVEYGGNNIVHWSFLDDKGPDVERLCGKLFLIVDHDDPDPGSAKDERHKLLAKHLGTRFMKLPVREIENLLTPTVLRKTLIEEGESEDNLSVFSAEDYALKKIGEFIDETVIVDKAKKKRKHQDKYGALMRKNDFCSAAIKHMPEWKDLSSDAQELAKRILDFIRENNPR